MDNKTLVLIAAVTVNLLYFALAIAARSHLKQDVKSQADRLLTLTFWWPFYEFYEETAKTLRLTGLFLLVASAGLYIWWATM
jgi:hypothetical protein